MKLGPEYVNMIEESGVLELQFDVLNCKLEISNWQNGLSIRYWDDEQWQQLEDDPGLPLLDILDQDPEFNPLLRCWAETIPETVREWVRRFVYYQWTLLCFLSKFEPAIDLLKSNPVLTWLLAIACKRRRYSDEQISDLLLHKQKDILAKLYDQDSLSAVKFLRKISIDRFTANDFETILAALQDSEIHIWLQNQKQVNSGQLRLLMIYPYFRPYRFLRPIFQNIKNDDTGYLTQALHINEILADTVRLGIALAMQNVENILHNSPTFEHISRIHDRWSDRVYRMNNPRRPNRELNRNLFSSEDNDDYQKKRYPKPIIKGNDYIVPLRTHKALMDEGRAMQHCVGGYHFDVKSGSSTIYKVLYPERATLEIVKEDSGPQIGQFKLSRNRYPGRLSKLLLYQWFSASCNNPQSMRSYGKPDSPVVLIGIGNFGHLALKSLSGSLLAEVTPVFIDSLAALSNSQLPEVFYKIPLDESCLKGLPKRPKSEADRAMICGFRDLINSAISGASHIIIVAESGGAGFNRLGIQISTWARKMGVRTCYVSNCAHSDSGRTNFYRSLLQRFCYNRYFDLVSNGFSCGNQDLVSSDVEESLQGSLENSLNSNVLASLLTVLKENHFKHEKVQKDPLTLYSGKRLVFADSVETSKPGFDKNQVMQSIDTLLKKHSATNPHGRYCYVIQVTVDSQIDQADCDQIRDYLLKRIEILKHGEITFARRHSAFKGTQVTILISQLSSIRYWRNKMLLFEGLTRAKLPLSK